MEKWEYKSLEWIHRVREDDYNETKTLSPKELIDKTRKATTFSKRAWSEGCTNKDTNYRLTGKL